MSEQIRIDFYADPDEYGEIEFEPPIFTDIQRDQKVSGEFLVGRTIERVDLETADEILLTLRERED